ncbi:tetratricopeptide repeat protein [Plakobranchus ocellatus]|uniref:Tetratricopeptide repeat protein n=1 Tax=Plakobranchus ocellatus TaxID=259542 RepID=A0AAV3XSK1_9GAST|nr:tetratricopeptide repeat protein [Plakobranchus ocellatus]
MTSAGSRRALKESGTCRVFVSSPFGGFEEEREELVLKLFPKLSHLCQAKGIQLATVDMRWGITEEATSDAQTVNICLREVDRSDIFVGLYGQRYGWHGLEDAVLQKNIDNALRQYPWLAKVKDRSVTEMEILHGHLNKPGAMPAIFAFRNKAYDDSEKAKAERAKDTRTALKFTSESDDAFKKINNLRDRVIKTKTKCAALMESYSTPHEGAQFVYNELKSLIEKAYLSSAGNLTKREEQLAFHEAYLTARTTLFVGGENNSKALDVALQKGQHVVIVGKPGSGKAALLSHWLNGLRKKKSPFKQILHFVGCSSDSLGIPEFMVRLTEELQHVMGNVTKSKSEQLSQGGEDLKPQSADVSQLCHDFQSALVRAAARHKILLVIDGLGKFQQVSRSAKDLFWLPHDVPKNVTIVVTCRDSDKVELAELTDRRFTSLQVNPLELSQRQEMCKELLKQNSKELSSAQLKKIVDSGQTSSPLYLKTVVSELCAFGKFRELNEKIDELITCKSVKELFEVFIRRLESDYITNAKTGNIIEQIKISKEWMTADGVYIPKEQDSKGINQFRPISLLNVEGKIFFSSMASRLTKYLTENGYINTSVQKGGIPGVSGCLEHATMIWEAIQRTNSEKLNLDVVC